MGEIKLNRDELEKDIRILDSLNDRVCSILRDSENIGLKLNTIKEVSVSSQRNALSNMQDSLYNLSRKFEDMRDDIYNAVRSYDSSENNVNKIIEKGLGYVTVSKGTKSLYNMASVDMDNVISNVGQVTLAAQVKNLFLGVAKGCVKFFGGSEETIAEIESLRQQSDEFLEKYVPNKDVFKVSKTVIDFGSYLIPYFGAGRAVFEAFTGVNAVTGEKMGVFDRILSILSVVGVGVLYKSGSKLLSKTGGVFSKISGKALQLLDKGGNKLLSKLEKIFPKLEGKAFNIEKFITENYTKIAEKISKGLGNFKSKVLNIFEDAGNWIKSLKNKSVELLKTAGRKIEETAYKLMHTGADLIRKAACGIDDFIAKAKALVPQHVVYPDGTIGIEKGLYKNSGACEKAAEDFISYTKDNLKEVKKVIVKPKYLEKVDDLLTHITENPNVNKNCTFEELCEIYNAKGANPKYTKKEIAAAYYKYTGKLDQIDLIDYQKILKDDGRPVTQAGVKKGEAKNHAHHICYKRGQDGVVNEIAMQGQEILRKYDIDPILDPHNLVPAPNKGHSEANIREVVEGLRKAERNGLKYVDRKGLKGEERIQYIKQFLYKELERLGEIAKGR